MGGAEVPSKFFTLIARMIVRDTGCNTDVCETNAKNVNTFTLRTFRVERLFKCSKKKKKPRFNLNNPFCTSLGMFFTRSGSHVHRQAADIRRVPVLAIRSQLIHV
jgi:hypothetical protein